MPCQGALSTFFDHIHSAIEDDNGDTVRVGKGLDGYYYRLVVCKHNPPHSPKRKFTDPNDQTGTLQCSYSSSVKFSVNGWVGLTCKLYRLSKEPKQLKTRHRSFSEDLSVDLLTEYPGADARCEASCRRTGQGSSCI
jgi:hypothetical protein